MLEQLPCMRSICMCTARTASARFTNVTIQRPSGQYLFFRSTVDWWTCSADRRGRCRKQRHAFAWCQQTCESWCSTALSYAFYAREPHEHLLEQQRMTLHGFRLMLVRHGTHAWGSFAVAPSPAMVLS